MNISSKILIISRLTYFIDGVVLIITLICLKD